MNCEVPLFLIKLILKKRNYNDIHLMIYNTTFANKKGEDKFLFERQN